MKRQREAKILYQIKGELRDMVTRFKCDAGLDTRSKKKNLGHMAKHEHLQIRLVLLNC